MKAPKPTPPGWMLHKDYVGTLVIWKVAKVHTTGGDAHELLYIRRRDGSIQTYTERFKANARAWREYEKEQA